MGDQYVGGQDFGHDRPPERLSPLPQVRARQRCARGDRRPAIGIMFDGVDAGERGRVLPGGTIGTGVCSWSRGRGVVNFSAPKRGLRGVPVGISAKALRANGLRPFLHTSNPPAVKAPHLMRSRRET